MNKKEILKEFIGYWNAKDLDNCILYLDEDVVLRSSYVQKLFPESNGIIKGKDQVVEYIKLLFKGLKDIEVSDFEIEQAGDYYIAKGDNNVQNLNYYLHYYVNDNNLIYLIKSNLTRPV